jgi:hypothetical protein
MAHKSSSAANDVKPRAVRPAHRPGYAAVRGARQDNRLVALRSAVGGAAEGRPTRMQSCGQRRAATIGVMQISPKRS